MAGIAVFFPWWNAFKIMLLVAFSIFVFFHLHLKGNWNTCFPGLCDWFFYQSGFIRSGWTGSCMFLIRNLTKCGVCPFWASASQRERGRRGGNPNQTNPLQSSCTRAVHLCLEPEWVQMSASSQVQSHTSHCRRCEQLQNRCLAPRFREGTLSFCVELLSKSIHCAKQSGEICLPKTMPKACQHRN